MLPKDNRAPHIFGFCETFLDEEKQASMIWKLITLYLRDVTIHIRKVVVS